MPSQTSVVVDVPNIPTGGKSILALFNPFEESPQVITSDKEARKLITKYYPQPAIVRILATVLGHGLKQTPLEVRLNSRAMDGQHLGLPTRVAAGKIGWGWEIIQRVPLLSGINVFAYYRLTSDHYREEPVVFENIVDALLDAKPRMALMDLLPGKVRMIQRTHVYGLAASLGEKGGVV